MVLRTEAVPEQGVGDQLVWPHLPSSDRWPLQTPLAQSEPCPCPQKLQKLQTQLSTTWGLDMFVEGAADDIQLLGTGQFHKVNRIARNPNGQLGV